MEYGICKECKKFYQKDRPKQEICPHCMNDILFNNPDKPKMSDIERIANLARQYGMSYGEFVAKYERKKRW